MCDACDRRKRLDVLAYAVAGKMMAEDNPRYKAWKKFNDRTTKAAIGRWKPVLKKMLKRQVASVAARLSRIKFLKMTREEFDALSEEEQVQFLEDATGMDRDEWAAEYERETAPLYEETALSASEAVNAEYDLSVDFSQYDPTQADWIGDRMTKFSDQIAETTINDIADELTAGVEEGEGIDELAARLEQFGEEYSDYRGERIARTEVISSSNQAALETYQEAGIEQKEWLATQDDRTREDHADADGQRVGIEENFDVGGEELSAPGDGELPENNINCRCAVIPVTAQSEDRDEEDLA